MPMSIITGGIMSFKIKNIIGNVHDTSYGGYPYKITVMIEVDNAYFKKLKGDLGPLVLDVNNAAYRIDNSIPAHNPSIDSRGHRRAVKGIKTMEFCYFMRDHARAEKLGFELLKLRSGEIIPKYGQYVSIFQGV